MSVTHHSPGNSRHAPPSRADPAPGPWPKRAEPPPLRAGEIHLWYLPNAAPLPDPTSDLLPMDEWRRRVGAVAIAAPELAFRCWTWVPGPAGDR